MRINAIAFFLDMQHLQLSYNLICILTQMSYCLPFFHGRSLNNLIADYYNFVQDEDKYKENRVERKTNIAITILYVIDVLTEEDMLLSLSCRVLTAGNASV